MLFANLILLLLAYRPLLGSVPEATTAASLELAADSWFFEPTTDVAPGVVVALSAWLFYRRRHLLFSLPRKSASFMAVSLCLGVGAGAYCWATMSGAPDLLAVSLIFNILGFALLLGGTPAFRASLLPAGVLLFAVTVPPPLFNEIIFKFQMWTSQYAGWILYQIGVPGFVSGDQILQYGKRFVVIESCSGLRSVETLTMLAILLVDLFHRRGWHAAIIIGAAPLVAFALNGFRVVGLILNPASRIAAIHTLQGIVILLGGLVTLYLIDGALSRIIRSRRDLLPERGGNGSPASGRWSSWAIAVILVLSVGLGWLLPRWEVKPTLGPAVTSRDVEQRLEGWVSTPLDQQQLRFFLGTVGLRQALHRRYRLGAGEDVELFVGLGVHTHRDRSPFSPKTALPGSGWAIESESVRVLGDRGPRVLERVLRSSMSNRRILAYHWYEGGNGLARETWRSLVALDRTPWHRQRDALAIRLSTDVDGPNEEDRSRAGERLDRFYLGLVEALNASRDS